MAPLARTRIPRSGLSLIPRMGNSGEGAPGYLRAVPRKRRYWRGPPRALLAQADLLHEILVVPEEPFVVHRVALPVADRRHADRESLAGGRDALAIRCR